VTIQVDLRDIELRDRVEDGRLPQLVELFAAGAELFAFYRRWGFTEQVGRSTLMRLTR
jgi:hypothetical protein